MGPATQGSHTSNTNPQTGTTPFVGPLSQETGKEMERHQTPGKITRRSQHPKQQQQLPNCNGPTTKISTLRNISENQECQSMISKCPMTDIADTQVPKCAYHIGAQLNLKYVPSTLLQPSMELHIHPTQKGYGVRKTPHKCTPRTLYSPSIL